MFSLESLDQIPALAQDYLSLTKDPNATRTLGTFGLVFVWSDERPPDVTMKGGLRFLEYLLWYRDSLMRQIPFAPFAKYWDAFRERCPTWPGFAEERRDPSLLAELERERAELLKELNEIHPDAKLTEAVLWHPGP
jgi:hypothetical protein